MKLLLKLFTNIYHKYINKKTKKLFKFEETKEIDDIKKVIGYEDIVKIISELPTPIKPKNIYLTKGLYDELDKEFILEMEQQQIFPIVINDVHLAIGNSFIIVDKPPEFTVKFSQIRVEEISK